jgi:hypothetical protein
MNGSCRLGKSPWGEAPRILMPRHPHQLQLSNLTADMASQVTRTSKSVHEGFRNEIRWWEWRFLQWRQLGLVLAQLLGVLWFGAALGGAGFLLYWGQWQGVFVLVVGVLGLLWRLFLLLRELSRLAGTQRAEQRARSWSLWKSELDYDFRSKFFRNSQQLCEKSSRTPVTESSLYFALLNQWVQDCDKNDKCKPKAQFWPTRVIFVGDSDSTELELWERESKKSELSGVDGYVALSHRWGNPKEEEKKRWCTTRDNYQRRKGGFSVDGLPQTFKDAVQVTRALGKKCLWIDALCIIQTIQGEDDSDWKDEAGRMGQVFGSAHYTIAASSAMNWRKGFLERRHYRRFVQGPDERWTYTGGARADYTEDIGAACLNRRAWVLQERVLSRRTIHFTKRYVYWECGGKVRCENFKKLKP